MAEAFVPVDLLNPGQVFACLGFVEAAEILLGDAQGVFDWTEPSETKFRIRASGNVSPVRCVLEFLGRAEARAVALVGTTNAEKWIQSWGPDPLLRERSSGYPYPDPDSPATLMCILADGEHTLMLDHWGDVTRRDNVKFWAGARGYPGAALARDALDLVRDRVSDAENDPFGLSAVQSSSFRFDWRRDYIPIDLGFSLNDQSNIHCVGYPLVELLATIGLSHARPRRPEPRNKLVYEYAVIGRERHENDFWFNPDILRPALGLTPFPFPTRRFRMLLNWPGQEGQARSITTVIEESAE